MNYCMVIGSMLISVYSFHFIYIYMVHVFQGLHFLPSFYHKILTINNSDTLILTFENNVEKGENDGKQHFLLFNEVFYPVREK